MSVLLATRGSVVYPWPAVGAPGQLVHHQGTWSRTREWLAVGIGERVRVVEEHLGQAPVDSYRGDELMARRGKVLVPHENWLSALAWVERRGGRVGASDAYCVVAVRRIEVAAVEQDSRSIMIRRLPISL